MNHVGTKLLKTKRLVLRKIRLDDAEEMFQNWTSDENVAKYTTWTAHKSIEETKMFVEYIVHNYQNDMYYSWGIEMDGKLIGSVDVVYINEEAKECGIGYVLSRNNWNKGIMTEALSRVIEFLFQEVEVEKIIAGYDEENIASGQVMRKAGMKMAGVQDGIVHRKDGTLGNSVSYELFRQEFAARLY